MNDQPPSPNGEVMASEELVEETGLFFSDRNVAKNIYARILHGLTPAIRHEIDTVTAKPGCKWQFTPDIYCLIPTLEFEEHRADHFPGIQIMDSLGEQLFDDRFGLCRRDIKTETTKTIEQIGILILLSWFSLRLLHRPWLLTKGVSGGVKQNRLAIHPAIPLPNIHADLLHLLGKEGAAGVNTVERRREDPLADKLVEPRSTQPDHAGHLGD